MTKALVLLEGMRPLQWSKNLFVFVGLVFTDNWQSMPRVIAAFAAYCLISSGVYLVNDVRDRDRDRVHPEKRRRPIARGDLTPTTAIIAGALFASLGVSGASALGPRSALTAVAFLTLQLAYTLFLKTVVLVDVFTIAMAFVLRVTAGAAAINVPVSEWLLICTLQLALFLGFGKRRNELVTLSDDAGAHRIALEQYSIAFLDQMISIILGSLIVSYAVYSAASPTAAAHPGMVATLPFVIYGVFRYLYVIHIQRLGGSPETVLVKDRPLQIALAAWLITVIAAFHLRW